VVPNDILLFTGLVLFIEVCYLQISLNNFLILKPQNKAHVHYTCSLPCVVSVLVSRHFTSPLELHVYI
jgi:hypothetical protein